jgi:hypothetical protein
MAKKPKDESINGANNPKKDKKFNINVYSISNLSGEAFYSWIKDA